MCEDVARDVRRSCVTRKNSSRPPADSGEESMRRKATRMHSVKRSRAGAMWHIRDGRPGRGDDVPKAQTIKPLPRRIRDLRRGGARR
eukprot:364962-Prorocentrum_minimum.AAC.1